MSSARTSSGNSAHVASSTRTPADAARAAAAANDDRRPGPNPVAVGAPPSSAPVPPSRVPSSARAGDSPSSTPSDQTTRLRFADDPNAPRDEPRDLAADLSADGGGGADRGADGANVVVVRGVVIFVSCRSSVGTTTRATPSTGNATRTRVAVASTPAATSAPAIAAEFSSTFASSFASSFASLTSASHALTGTTRVGSTTAARAPYAAAEDAAATRIASSDANRRESRPAVDVVVVSRRARVVSNTTLVTHETRASGAASTAASSAAAGSAIREEECKEECIADSATVRVAPVSSSSSWVGAISSVLGSLEGAEHVGEFPSSSTTTRV